MTAWTAIACYGRPLGVQEARSIESSSGSGHSIFLKTVILCRCNCEPERSRLGAQGELRKRGYSGRGNLCLRRLEPFVRLPRSPASGLRHSQEPMS